MAEDHITWMTSRAQQTAPSPELGACAMYTLLHVLSGETKALETVSALWLTRRNVSSQPVWLA